VSKQIRLKIPGESFWAFQYDDLPANQAEVNNNLMTTDQYAYGDRVEFDEDRNVTRLVMTRAEVADALRRKGGGHED
jgi:hypothetical protein